MKVPDPYMSATLAGERAVKDRGITSLSIDPIQIARDLGITVIPKPASSRGVSGMLLRNGDEYGIAYATHIDNVGFQHFSVAHELGHFLLPGHVDAVLGSSHVHESRAGFTSGERFEMEADHFAAGFLMPKFLFVPAMRSAGDGLSAIESLKTRCSTSLTATAIRFTQCTLDPMAIVVSSGAQIDYCFMSNALKEVDGIDWIRKRAFLPKNSATYAFNQDSDRVQRSDKTEDTSDLQDWFGGPHSIQIMEEVIGLGSYGKTLTVLTASNLPDPEDVEEEDQLIDSWMPRFR